MGGHASSGADTVCTQAGPEYQGASSARDILLRVHFFSEAAIGVDLYAALDGDRRAILFVRALAAHKLFVLWLSCVCNTRISIGRCAIGAASSGACIINRMAAGAFNRYSR